MKTTVHIISHSHWDREWYLPFEKHRVKLIELMDNAMELFEKDERYRNFHLDGQTIVLDDYLEIRPENREKLKKYVQEGRFHVGPWYILQDEFLTSGEAAVRNLLTGMREAKEFGGLCPVGYFPDAFGNAGQMPQLLKQAGMKAVAFGRGVKPVGFNNEAKEGGAYESTYSEMNWESMDGSGLLGILFANWYNNGAEIPVEPEEAKEYWDQRLKEAKRFAGTSQLLFMNGCDHQPVQKDLGDAIETARKLYPDIDFIHSDFETYVQAVEKDLEENPTNSLSTVRGELTSQETDGFWTLVNTCSSHVELKKENRRGEAALEKEAEPLAALAALAGKEYPEDLLRYSWKKLMQNHPHDSICGCSVDAVNDEMKTRFDKSRQVAETVTEESAKYLADQIDTENAGGLDVAENGLRALEKLAKSEEGYYDAILMDIRMPIMDGLTASRSIRNLSNKDAANIPIIAMTANAFDDDVNKSKAAGMNAHLAKPIDPKRLFRTLVELIRSHEQNPGEMTWSGRY